MANNAFNTGKDASVVIIHPLATGGRLDLPLVTDFDSKPQWHDITSSALDGFTRTQHVPRNFLLSFSADRSNAAVEAFLSALVIAYRTVGRAPDGSVYHYISEIDGSTTTMQYDGVALKPDDLGSWKKEDRIMQKISGTAMDMRRI